MMQTMRTEVVDIVAPNYKVLKMTRLKDYMLC